MNNTTFTKNFRWALGLLIGLTLSACGSDNARLRERAQIEGEESAKKAVEIETRSREGRVQLAEEDLQRRLLFYNALEGKYLTQDEDGWDVELSIRSTLAYFKPNRVRTEEEVTNDLSRLALNIDMTYTKENATESYKAEDIKVDINNGLVAFKTLDHENQLVYDYVLSVGGVSESVDKPDPNGPRIAANILAGSINQIGKVWVKERRLRTREVFNLTMERAK